MLASPLGGLFEDLRGSGLDWVFLSPSHVPFAPPSFGADSNLSFQSTSPCPAVLSQLWQLQSEKNKDKTGNEQRMHAQCHTGHPATQLQSMGDTGSWRQSKQKAGQGAKQTPLWISDPPLIFDYRQIMTFHWSPVSSSTKTDYFED